MQIYEITQPTQLKESLAGELGRGMFKGATGIDLPNDPGKDAAQSAAALQAKGYGAGGSALPAADWQVKFKQIGSDPAIAQYASGLAQGWLKVASNMPSKPAAAPTQTATQASSGNWRQDALKSAGASVPKEPAKPETPVTTAATSATVSQPKFKPKYGQASAEIEPVYLGGKKLDPKNPKDAQILAQMKQQGKLNEAPAEYTTPGGIVVPSGSKTDATPTAPVAPAVVDNDYGQNFERWADQQLATRVPMTGETINMNMVRARFPDLSEKLDQALEQVVATKGTAAHVQAIQNYIKLAVAGVQAEAQRSKNQYGTVKTDLGIGSQELANLKALARTPAGKEILKKQLGL